ncbi:hypothetical protein V5799_003563 [Amblyomma americanum]|uniref:Uncharacterized protein n=1 Tax=Amblyomma americanum TaxID=6943 RepID=A0AAQ4D8L3_AMBAM
MPVLPAIKHGMSGTILHQCTKPAIRSQASSKASSFTTLHVNRRKVKLQSDSSAAANVILKKLATEGQIEQMTTTIHEMWKGFIVSLLGMHE